MNFSPDLEASRRRWWGFAAVLGLHVVVGWALTQGLATQVVAFVKPPVQVALIAETLPPPPPPPPPEPVAPKVASPQKVVASSPPPAAPPLVQAAATELPSPAAITPTPPAPPALPEAVVAAPPPPAPPAVLPSAVPQAMGLVCPRQVKPVPPRQALQEGINGRVEARATVRVGKVVAVEILNAKPRGVFEAAVKQAMLQYRCDATATGDVLADQVFEFKFDE